METVAGTEQSLSFNILTRGSAPYSLARSPPGLLFAVRTARCPDWLLPGLHRAGYEVGHRITGRIEEVDYRVRFQKQLTKPHLRTELPRGLLPLPGSGNRLPSQEADTITAATTAAVTRATHLCHVHTSNMAALHLFSPRTRLQIQFLRKFF